MTKNHSAGVLRVAGFDRHQTRNVGGAPSDGNGGAGVQKHPVQQLEQLHGASVPCGTFLRLY